MSGHVDRRARHRRRLLRAQARRADRARARCSPAPRLRRFAELVPVALLAALVAVQAGAKGSALVLDPARLAGLAAAVVALLLRAPFLVVIVVAAATAALLRLAGVG